MNPQTCTRYDTVRGTIETMDLLGREVRVQAGDRGLDLNVPVECPIIMYEERVRLRMLQPRDAVEVLFTWDNGQAQAQSIEVLSPVRRLQAPPSYRIPLQEEHIVR